MVVRKSNPEDRNDQTRERNKSDKKISADIHLEKYLKNTEYDVIEGYFINSDPEARFIIVICEQLPSCRSQRIVTRKLLMNLFPTSSCLGHKSKLM